jgi:hypothetical protein
MPTATAASSAASSATRFRNFSARSSVWRISGRPLSSDSTRTPRSGACAMRSRPLHEALHGGVAGAGRGHRQPVGDAAGRLHQAGGRQVGLVQHHTRRKVA